MLWLRKFFSLILMLGVILSTSVAMADYPKYLNGDRNYVLVDGTQGTAWYAVRNSLNVERYNPPNYIISINIVVVDNADRGNTKIRGSKIHRFYYDWEFKKAYIQADDGSLSMLDPNAKGFRRTAMADRAEIVFYLAYKKKFWGSCSENFYPTE